MQSVKTETLQDIKKTRGENRKEFTARLMEETEKKYKEALRLYEETDLSVSRIARQENLNPKALRSYIGRRHRHLLLK